MDTPSLPVLPALQALYARQDPQPTGAPAPGRLRASICVEVTDAEAVARIEQWMLAAADQLTCVHSTGCGCCVIGWEIEGPQALLATLPQGLSAPGWARDDAVAAPMPIWQRAWQAWRRWRNERA
ncbi:hypothetical protein [Xanthomonas maliensis]|uniref:hypothetical protein n=1 Tax=Xanthomonas maliensis TaxID=1321368 RepID=UPI00039AEC0A|nr:hypothetical protein [Xanthomonas maliensis]KAB7772556.1 hypothetical protein CKY51_00130 [Xanthomonas maliensis]